MDQDTININDNNDIISDKDQENFAIGVSLAVASSIFIGGSFIVKKIGLRRSSRNGTRPKDGGLGYLKDILWWTGLLLMGLGEAFNFVAYAFAPASLVTPLGALSVLISAVLSSKFLKENLNFLGKLGCFLCVLGSTVIVLHSPKHEEINSVDELETMLKEPLFLGYLMVILLTFVAIVFYFGPRYGNENILVYLLLCSSVGSLTVIFCKGLGISLRETLSGTKNDLDSWVIWILLISTVICIMIQMNFLNKSLDIFNTSIVTPIYYVLFTTLVIISSSILFKEWQHLGYFDILGNICGFLVIIVGIVLLNAFKEVNVSLKDSPFSSVKMRPETIQFRPCNMQSSRTEIVYGSTQNVTIS